MTADLVARLEADANEIVADWHRSMGLPLPNTVRQRVDLLREAASALRSSRGAVAWRPIAEAPRDGRVFLVYMPEERRSIQTAWQNENGVMAIGSCFSFDLTPVTHWMPLPAPPTSTEGG